MLTNLRLFLKKNATIILVSIILLLLYLNSTDLNYRVAGPVCSKYDDFQIIQATLSLEERDLLTLYSGVKTIVEADGTILWRIHELTHDRLEIIWNQSTKAAQSSARKVTGKTHDSDTYRAVRIGNRLVDRECEFMAQWLVNPIGRPKKLKCGDGRCIVLPIE